MSATLRIDLPSIQTAQEAIAPHLWRTPLLHSAGLGRLSGSSPYLKLECWQRTGSFKVRGALSFLAERRAAETDLRAVTASAGNHGLGVAFACQALGLPPADVFLPEGAVAAKVEQLNKFHVRIHRAGADYDAAHREALAHLRAEGGTFVSAYDHPLVIAGQGTVGLEILEDLPDPEVVLVPVGGGGLLAGVAVALRALRPSVRIWGVQPDASPAAYLSFRDGRPYDPFDSRPTICDGLAGGFGRLAFEVAKELVDEVLLVPEAGVRHAVAWLLAHEQLLVEASGAIAVAPLLAGEPRLAGRRVVAILTGRNIDAPLVRTLLEEYSAA